MSNHPKAQTMFEKRDTITHMQLDANLQRTGHIQYMLNLMQAFFQALRSYSWGCALIQSAESEPMGTVGVSLHALLVSFELSSLMASLSCQTDQPPGIEIADATVLRMRMMEFNICIMNA